MFYTKHLPILKDVCASGPAAYLTSAAQSDENEEECIQSPLHVGIENSRRFRALPLYASLVAYGKQGYAEMIRRNIEFIREIDAWMRLSKWYEVFTPQPANTIGENLAHSKHETTNILLFGITLNVPDRFKGEFGMRKVVEAINASRSLYITGTTFNGRDCARIAVSNWRTGLRAGPEASPTSLSGSHDADLQEVLKSLTSVMSD